MVKQSAGLLLYRQPAGRLEVFLVHPGGPFWAKKDLGAWSIPKGEYEDGEIALEAAIREMKEETGIAVAGDFIPLTSVRQKSGKLVHAWAIAKDIDAAKVKSNFFDMQWPPKSGQIKSFPEIDKGAWFTIEEALIKIVEGQQPLLGELKQKMADASK